MYEDLDASLINYNKAIILLQARSCMPPIQAATCAPEVPFHAVPLGWAGHSAPSLTQEGAVCCGGYMLGFDHMRAKARAPTCARVHACA
jgi:hypothetical protein